MGMQSLLKKVEYVDGIKAIDEVTLKKLQKILLEMVKDISEVLDAENIKWTLIAGSLLGAVRHDGFIPWDDDIDLLMEREEFEKLKMCFNEKLSDKYELKLPGDKGYIYHYPQIYSKDYKIRTLQSVSQEGLFIDVFLLENTYDDYFRRTLHGLKCTALLFIDSVIRMRLCKENIIKYTKNNKKLKNAVQIRSIFSFIFSFMKFEKWLSVSDKCFSAVKKKHKYVVIPSGAKHFFGEMYDTSKMTKYKRHKFETEDWSILDDADYYLKLRYGDDYMKIPEEGDREYHSYIEINLDKKE